MQNKIIAILLATVMSVNILAVPIFAKETVEDEEQNYGLIPYTEDNDKIFNMLFPQREDQNADPIIPEIDGDGGINVMSLVNTSELPESYNTDVVNQTDKVRNQGKWGTCWAFSSMTTLERRMEQDSSQKYDFSEEYMLQKMGKYGGLGYSVDTKNFGGNCFMSYAYMAGLNGIMNESDYPYDTRNDLSPDFDSSDKGNLRATDISYFFSSSSNKRNGEDRIKEECVNRAKATIMEYGSIVAEMYWGNTSKNYNPKTGAYRYNGGFRSANHQITIVGWDDNYDASNFLPSSGVKENGAWIIQNSYGTNYGINGYNYVSYEDIPLTPLGTIMGYETVAPDETVYDHDCGMPRIGYKNLYYRIDEPNRYEYDDGTMYYGNYFPLNGKESIESVSFFTNEIIDYLPLDEQGLPLDIYVVPVYTNEKGQKVLENGKRQLVCAGYIPSYTGWHTVKFDPVTFDTDEVAVYIHTTGMYFKTEGVNEYRYNPMWLEFNHSYFDTKMQNNESFYFMLTGDKGRRIDDDIKPSELKPAAYEFNPGVPQRVYNYNNDEIGNIAIKIKTKHAHTYEVYETKKPATCTEDGLGVYQCACGESYEGVIPKLDHAYEETGRKDATCKESGYVDYKCAGCEKTKQEILPKENEQHTYGEGVITKAPTCGTTGTMEYKCLTCDKTKTETLPLDPGNHKFVDGEGIIYKSTCAYTGKQRCECGKETRDLPLTDHEYNEEYTRDVRPTCISKGEESRHCKREFCGARTDVREVPVVDHDYQVIYARSYGCQEKKVEVSLCPGCMDRKERELEEYGDHIRSEKVIQRATVFSTGKKDIVCGICNASFDETQTIPKLAPTIKLSATSKSIKKKKSFTLKVSGLAYGDAIKSYVSSKKKVATVTAKGVVKGKKKGTAYITVTLKSGKTAKCKVKVK